MYPSTPRSLGWRTDLIFARFDGEVSPRSDHLVIRTPHNPGFWWGNFLLFDHAPRAGEAFRIGALRLPEQAAAAVEMQVVADAGQTQSEAAYRLFRERQMRRYEAMARAGMGDWFAVFSGDAMVADCGLFRAPGESLGRFQHVVTHPLWRRRGLCSALIHAVCLHGFETMGLETLVIVADPDDVAIGLYESLGFQRGASTWHLEKAALRSA